MALGRTSRMVSGPNNADSPRLVFSPRRGGHCCRASGPAESTKDGATVYVVDLDGSSLKSIGKGAKRYGEGNPVYVQFGRGEFIGIKKEDGSDREQGDSARRVYE